MIVQCRKCGTRYRFDEDLIEGEGAWVRCSRCSSVFFQTEPAQSTDQLLDKPAREDLAADDWRQLEEKIADNTLPEIDLHQAAGEDDPMARARLAAIGMVAEPQAGDDNALARLGEIEKTVEVGGDAEVPYDIPWNEEQIKPQPKRSIMGRILAYFFLFLILLAVGGFSFYQFYPQESRGVLEMLAEQVPEAGRLLGLEKQQKPTEHQVQFSELRQRFIHNVILGSMRVVEGTLTNAGPYPLARLKVKGEIWDAQGMIIGERVAYCGNILTDDDLMNSSEEDIVRITSRPEGNAFQNDRLPPGGKITFMLIFVRENAGGVKTMVTFAGAERLN